MNVKLLKKVRKRFGWYINNDGDPILLDKITKKTTLFNSEHCALISGYKDSKEATKEISISVDLWKWRLFNEAVIKPFGYTFDHMIYKTVLKNCNTSTKRRIPDETSKV